MEEYGKRTIKVLWGLLLYALGSYLTIQANIGLAPWEAFSIGISNVAPLSYGQVVVVTGILILVIDVLAKEKIGLGTILNTLLIGTFVDWFRSLQLLPMLENFWWGLLMLLVGNVVICLASYFYISPGMGCGPRDSLMVALGKRFHKLPIGLVRGLLEGTVLLIGWLLGAKVGLGTVVSVFGISFILQWTFHFLRFDVKAVHHESIFETIGNIRKLLQRCPQEEEQ